MNQNNYSSTFDLAASFVLHTRQHIFLTGKAGTGKTTFLKHIKEKTSKNTVVVAPTGVAAINAGGVTVHSFFQLPMGSFIPHQMAGFSLSPAAGTDLNTLLRNIRFNKEKRKLLQELELLIIDEVSMLRADMLDAMDGILRHFRKKYEQPFGGVQVLYIGDLYQLPPVVKEEEWNMLNPYYKSMFFFDAQVIREVAPLNIELDKVYRQSDEKFISLLNKIRNNEAGDEDLRMLNKYYDPAFYPEPEEGYIILTSHNYKAAKINQSALARLNNEIYEFEGTLSGDFNENALPVEKSLCLKEGAQIMFIRNDKGENRRFYNGKIGVVSRIKKEKIYVRFPDEKEEMLLEQETWRNIRYHYNEAADQIEEEELGAYKQYPVRLAWAVTIHKSQGLSFEKAIVDAGQSFAAGQVYVALSRLRSLNGLVLASPIPASAISTDEKIVSFSKIKPEPEALREKLEQEQKIYFAEKVIGSFDWGKILDAFREHHQTYRLTKLPHQTESVEWSAEMIEHIIRLKAVGDKFTLQLYQILEKAEQDHYQALSQRLKAASAYFEEEISEHLLRPWTEHFEKTKGKGKIKKYLRSLQPLYTLILRKKQQIGQATILAEGMAKGKSITHLLEHYQNTHKNIPPVPEEDQKIIIAKEDSKSLSLNLLREGKSINEIAAARGLVKSTIEGHLVQFLDTGEVKLEQLISPEQACEIREAALQSEKQEINAVRAATGYKYSYSIVRAVLLEIKQEQGALE